MKALKKFAALLALVAFPALASLGPNSQICSLSILNANVSTGTPTALSTCSQVLHIPNSGTIFTGSDAKYGTVGIDVHGTWVGTITFQYSQDELNWVSLNVNPVPFVIGTGPSVTTTTGNGNWMVNSTGYTSIRATFSAYTSGTATVSMTSFTTGPSPEARAVLALPALAYNNAVGGTAVQIKGTVGQLRSLHLGNTTAAVAYLQLFCLPSASVTPATTVPSAAFFMAASATNDIQFQEGVCNAGTGITLAGTTTADGGTTANIAVVAVYE